MMCKKCGRETGKQAKFCSSCGAPCEEPQVKKSQKFKLGEKVAIAIAVVTVLLVTISGCGTSSGKTDVPPPCLPARAVPLPALRHLRPPRPLNPPKCLNPALLRHPPPNLFLKSQ